MKENKLVEPSMDFSVDMINLVKMLKANHETILSNQIGRSGTSIGANIHEAPYAQGTKILYPNLKSRSKNVAKLKVGYSCYSTQTTWMKKPIKNKCKQQRRWTRGRKSFKAYWRKKDTPQEKHSEQLFTQKAASMLFSPTRLCIWYRASRKTKKSLTSKFWVQRPCCPSHWLWRPYCFCVLFT